MPKLGIKKKRLNPRIRDKAHKQRRKPTQNGVADRNLSRDRTHILRKIRRSQGKRPGSGAHERRCLSLLVVSVFQLPKNRSRKPEVPGDTASTSSV